MRMKKLIILVAALALLVAACGGGNDGGGDTTGTVAPGDGDPVAGADIYKGTCSACHGPDLAGIEGLGKPLAPSDFVSSQSEDELVAFILVGRPAGDPDNTQGIDMPPKGGNPSLNEQDIHDGAAYLVAQN